MPQVPKSIVGGALDSSWAIAGTDSASAAAETPAARMCRIMLEPFVGRPQSSRGSGMELPACSAADPSAGAFRRLQLILCRLTAADWPSGGGRIVELQRG